MHFVTLCFHLINNKNVKNKFKKFFLMILFAVNPSHIYNVEGGHSYANLHFVFEVSHESTLPQPPLP